jgi:hypothetical protein
MRKDRQKENQRQRVGKSHDDPGPDRTQSIPVHFHSTGIIAHGDDAEPDQRACVCDLEQKKGVSSQFPRAEGHVDSNGWPDQHRHHDTKHGVDALYRSGPRGRRPHERGVLTQSDASEKACGGACDPELRGHCVSC